MIPPKITLEAARVNAGFQQKEAAKALHVTPATLRNWESGRSVPKWDKVQDIATLYAYPSEFIFFGSNPLKGD